MRGEASLGDGMRRRLARPSTYMNSRLTTSPCEYVQIAPHLQVELSGRRKRNRCLSYRTPRIKLALSTHYVALLRHAILDRRFRYLIGGDAPIDARRDRAAHAIAHGHCGGSGRGGRLRARFTDQAGLLELLMHLRVVAPLAIDPSPGNGIRIVLLGTNATEQKEARTKPQQSHYYIPRPVSIYNRKHGR